MTFSLSAIASQAKLWKEPYAATQHRDSPGPNPGRYGDDNGDVRRNRIATLPAEQAVSANPRGGAGSVYSGRRCGLQCPQSSQGGKTQSGLSATRFYDDR